MTDGLMTKAEAAALLGMSVHTLTKKVTARKVQFTWAPGTRLVRFSKADIEANIAASRELPEAVSVIEVRPKRNKAA